MIGADGLLEQDGEIVNDCVTAADLLEELGRGTEQHAAEVLRFTVREESLDGSALLAITTRGTERIDNEVALEHSLGASLFVTTDGGDDAVSFRLALVAQKPSRRLGKEHHGEDDEHGEDDLEGNRETPDKVIRPVGSTVVEPVGDQCTESDDTTFDTDQKSSIGRLTAFSCGHCQLPVSCVMTMLCHSPW